MAKKGKAKGKGLKRHAGLLERLHDYDLPELREGKPGIPEGEMMAQRLKGVLAVPKVGISEGSMAAARVKAARKRKRVGISEAKMMRERVKAAGKKGKRGSKKPKYQKVDYTKLSPKLDK